MSASSSGPTWRFCRFGLIVTGMGESQFLPSLFRSLMSDAACTFEVIRRIGQRSPRTSPKRVLEMTGTGKRIPDRDATEIGLPARRYLSSESNFVVLVDDLEWERTSQAKEVFRRYRDAFDSMLKAQRNRASVHFLVNMLEAYYFADAAAVNEALGADLSDYAGDVETIPNPKAKLRLVKPSFDEVVDGAEVLKRLNVPHVLGRPDTCASLRALFGWCSKALGQQPGDRYRLDCGVYSTITGPQIGDLRC